MPVEDGEPAVTERVTRLIGQVVADKIDGKEFRELTPKQLAGYSEFYGGRLRPLGALQDLKLFRRSDAGDDAVYNYRARFANGLMDVVLVLDPQQKVSQLSFQPVSHWDAPL
jgi:hypothetical protein